VSDGGNQRRVGEVLEFRDVVVSPFTELLNLFTGGNQHKGGPAWPDWVSQTAARHCQVGRPVDTEPDPATPITTIDGPVAWGGPVTAHFGHQIGDFSMRLLPTARALPGVPIAFAFDPRLERRPADKPPDFFWGILDWLGIPREQVFFVSEPTLIKELFVVPQAEQVGGPGPDSATLDMFDDLVQQNLGTVARQGIFYVSRAPQVARLAGEEHLEQVLASSGVTILRPDDFRLGSIDLLPTYASAEVIIFVEGSAVHSMQLLGRSFDHVAVIHRRSWPGGAQFCRASLDPRAQSLTYIDSVTGLIHPLRPSGEPAREYGLTMLDPERLLDALSPLIPDLAARFDHDAYRRAQEDDVRRWLASLGPGWTSSPESRDHLRATIAEAGLTVDKDLDLSG
jgi:hypothetical protein